MALDQHRQRFLEKAGTALRVTQQRTDCTGLAPLDAAERRPRPLSRILRGLSTLAESIENRFNEGGAPLRGHDGGTLHDGGGQIGVIHLGESLLRRVNDLGRAEVPKYGHWRLRYAPAAGGSSKRAKNLRIVIRVRVPLDLHAVALSGSGAFALATPVRVRDLVGLAVREAIGARAPHDKQLRSVAATLAGLAAGRFTMDVNGRRYADADDVVVCEGELQVRFFLRSPVLH